MVHSLSFEGGQKGGLERGQSEGNTGHCMITDSSTNFASIIGHPQLDQPESLRLGFTPGTPPILKFTHSYLPRAVVLRCKVYHGTLSQGPKTRIFFKKKTPQKTLKEAHDSPKWPEWEKAVKAKIDQLHQMGT